MKHNIITPLIQDSTALILIAIVLLAVLTIVYTIIDIVRDSKQYRRKQVLKNYERAAAIMRRRLETSKETGVLYSKRK